MWKELSAGLRMMLVMTVLTGFIYPAVITGIAQVVFRDQANGSLIELNGQVERLRSNFVNGIKRMPVRVRTT